MRAEQEQKWWHAMSTFSQMMQQSIRRLSFFFLIKRRNAWRWVCYTLITKEVQGTSTSTMEIYSQPPFSCSLTTIIQQINKKCTNQPCTEDSICNTIYNSNQSTKPQTEQKFLLLKWLDKRWFCRLPDSYPNKNQYINLNKCQWTFNRWINTNNNTE